MVIAPKYTGDGGDRRSKNLAERNYLVSVYRAIRRIDWTPFGHAHIVARGLQRGTIPSLSESEAA
jgi:hypothetical protein